MLNHLIQLNLTTVAEHFLGTCSCEFLPKGWAVKEAVGWFGSFTLLAFQSSDF